MIPYGRQDIDEGDIAAVVAVLRSDFLTQGPEVPRFEADFAARVGAAHCVAVNSATAALLCAYRALDLGPGDVLWTSPITFVATANAALQCGAEVDFVDVDPDTLNLCPDALEDKLERAAREGRLPKIVVPVHFSGEPCDMARIAALAARFGFKVVEDASHAVGARFGNMPIGACAQSDIAVFSFHPVKIVTTGEGGAATTNDPALAARMRLVRSHGVTREPAEMTGPAEGAWVYEQVELGWNFRLTDMQAALGASQLRRLDGFLSRRHAIAAAYDADFAGSAIEPLVRRADAYSALHLYVVRLPDPDGAGTLRRTVFARMRESGIGVQVHYIPVHTQPFYRRLGFGPGLCPVAEAVYRRVISLPMFPTLTEPDRARVVETLRETLREARREALR